MRPSRTMATNMKVQGNVWKIKGCSEWSIAITSMNFAKKEIKNYFVYYY